MRMNNLEAQNGVLDAFNRNSIPDKHLIETDQINLSLREVFRSHLYLSSIFAPKDSARY